MSEKMTPMCGGNPVTLLLWLAGWLFIKVMTVVTDLLDRMFMWLGFGHHSWYPVAVVWTVAIVLWIIVPKRET